MINLQGLVFPRPLDRVALSKHQISPHPTNRQLNCFKFGPLFNDTPASLKSGPALGGRVPRKVKAICQLRVPEDAYSGSRQTGQQIWPACSPSRCRIMFDCIESSRPFAEEAGWPLPRSRRRTVRQANSRCILLQRNPAVPPAQFGERSGERNAPNPCNRVRSVHTPPLRPNGECRTFEVRLGSRLAAGEKHTTVFEKRGKGGVSGFCRTRFLRRLRWLRKVELTLNCRPQVVLGKHFHRTRRELRPASSFLPRL